MQKGRNFIISKCSVYSLWYVVFEKQLFLKPEKWLKRDICLASY